MKQWSLHHTRIILAAAVCVALLGAAATTPPASTPQAAEAGKGRLVLVVPVKGNIDPTQGAFLHRALSGAKGKYDAVILDIDTGGGDGRVMSKMSKEIMRLSPVPTIAFIRDGAISAGSYIAMSCDRIYMAPGSQIGGARAWVPGPDGRPVNLPKHLEEKIASINRAQFRALAETKGYPAAIAEGMTDESIEVTKVTFDGKTQYLTGEQIATIRIDPLKNAKLKIISVVSPKGRLITFSAQQAVEYDVATKVVADICGLLKEEGLDGAKVIRQERTGSDKVVAILTHPGVTGILILIGFGALWLEFQMPGFGIAGSISVVVFIVVFSSHFLVGNANAMEIMLFLIGLVLLAIELFVTPGFGFIGGAGLICLFVALLMGMQSFVIPSAPWEFETLQFNVLAVLGGILGSFAVMIGAWLLPSTPLFGKLALRTQLKADEGFGSGVQEADSLVGEQGVVVTALRPAGKIEIGDKTYSVVSDAEFVDEGQKARVVRVDGPKIIVEPIEEPKPREPEFEA